jgi:hypothetical protein
MSEDPEYHKLVSSRKAEKAVETQEAASNPLANGEANPFNLKSMALDQKYLEKAGTTKLLTTIPVGKPKSQFFIRVHPDPAFRSVYGILKLSAEGKIGDEFYVVDLPLLDELAGEPQLKPHTLYIYVTKQGNLGVWPIPYSEEGGRVNDWARTSTIGAEKAMSVWVRIVPNVGMGYNDILVANSDLGKPKWSDLPYEEILRVAFKSEGIITSLDHMAIKKLRGEI